MQTQLNRSVRDFAPDNTSQADTVEDSAGVAHDAVQASEQDLVDYLIDNPEFFVRHGHVLSNVRMVDPHSGRAVSLQERQLDVLRSRQNDLQTNLDKLVQLALQNDQISGRLAQFSHALLAVRQAAQTPDCVVQSLNTIFDVPQVALRLWDVSHDVDAAFTDDADADTRRMTDALAEPYCGLKGDIAQARWLDDGGISARSLALLPLRDAQQPEAGTFGLIVMGSTDADRFQNGMGTDFLDRIGQTAGAALRRLRNERSE